MRRKLSLVILLVWALLLSGCAATNTPPGVVQDISPAATEVAMPTQSITAEPVRMLALNVGKADALILKVSGKNYLIDTGTSKTFDQLEAGLHAMNVTHLDAVILTHTDKDHGGGMKKLANSTIPVDAWYASAYYIDKTEEKHQANVAAEIRGQDAVFLKAGDRIDIDDENYFSVIGPVRFMPDSENNNSLVMILHTPHGKIFLAGDMEYEEEQDVLNTGMVEKCAVFKVGHHGDNDATSLNLASKIRPQIAVISTSTEEENDTPSGDVVRVLKSVGATVAVTQNAKDGVLVTLKNNVATAENVAFN